MRRCKQGFILITTLIMLSVISLLIMNQYQQILLYSQIYNQRQKLYAFKQTLLSLSMPLVNATVQNGRVMLNDEAFTYTWKRVSTLKCVESAHGHGSLLYKFIIKNSKVNAHLEIYVIKKGAPLECAGVAQKILTTGPISWQFTTNAV